MKNLVDLPVSDDVNFWGDDGQRYRNTPKPIYLCPTHTKDNWIEHEGYEMESDGVIICTKCSWGSRVAGYYRVVGEKVIDLRTLKN